MINRRNFLISTAAAPLLAAGPALPIRKAVLLSMLPKSMSYTDRFKLAKEVGFAQVECPTTPDQKEAEEIKTASDAAGLPVHSVMNMAHWKYPLSSADPEVVAESRRGMETSLRNAHLWGAQTVLLVPAVVDPKTSYKDAWTRSVAEIKRMIPLAEQLKVIIAVEEVWNKFLLSPAGIRQLRRSISEPVGTGLFRRRKRSHQRLPAGLDTDARKAHRQAPSERLQVRKAGGPIRPLARRRDRLEGDPQGACRDWI